MCLSVFEKAEKGGKKGGKDENLLRTGWKGTIVEFAGAHFYFWYLKIKYSIQIASDY
jgi:hypothetical protein